MPITTYWYDDNKRILYSKYEGMWSLDEYYQNVALLVTMREPISHPIVLMMDFVTSDTLPPSMLSAGRQAERLTDKHILATYVFGLDMYHQIIAKVFLKVFPNVAKGIILVKSLEEALEHAQVTLKQTS